MSEQLKVSFIQTSLHWENVDQNLVHFSLLIKSIKEECDVIILPEMFNTGFSMNSEKLGEDENGKTIKWMKEISKLNNSAICGSIIFKENQHFYNRFIWVEPDGKILHYNKRHLFSLADEQLNYAKGSDKLIIEYKGWKICPMICYDLRFPVWSRNIEGYDLLLYIANWPERRNLAWNSLLPARAIENQCYVVGVNRIGNDGKGIPYSGNSAAYDFLGNILCSAASGHEEILKITIDKSSMIRFRNDYPFLKDGDKFTIIS